MPQKNIGLITAIVFASVVISGSLVFFGIQLSGKGGTGGEISAEKIEQAFESFVKKQQQKQADTQVVANAQEDEKSAELAKNVKPVSKSDDHIRGDVNAKISLIEYSDFECPFCKRFHETGKQIVDAYDGKVNWVYGHYPLDFHDPLATAEAEAAECANELGGNDKFWAMTDLIFETTTSNGRGMDINQLPDLAVQIGLNKDAFQKCLDADKYLAHIQKEIEEGLGAGVDGTPGNFVLNNETKAVAAIAGAQPLAVFQKEIDSMLNI